MTEINKIEINGVIYDDTSGDFLALIGFLEKLKEIAKTQQATSEGACFYWEVEIKAKGEWS